MTSGQVAREPIAIVGIGCRLPGGADSPDSLWDLLREGFDAIGPIPEDRFDADALYDARPATPGRIMSARGGYLSDIDRFDAEFFNIAPREAERLDPQQRLLLETAWEALEDAGVPRDRVAGSNTGVFVGMWTNEFESKMFADLDAIDFHKTTGSGRYAASGRLSYFLDALGPSITIDTACSSSLVAVHLACQALGDGDSDLALAGGTNLILDPTITIAYSQLRMMAPDGFCKFGDATADGYVRSEGAGLVALKRLSDAQADGDRIYAVIRGSAVSNDGGSSGLLARPGQAGQEAALRRAYERAGVDPSSVSYVEAHGTGTAAGDPVELAALGAVVGRGRPADAPCLVGSIKSNIGHAESAAGVAGLVKLALCLHHGHVPPSLHVHEPNPGIPFDELGLRVCTELTPLVTDGSPIRAGVTAFGIAGTNAHAVLESAPPPTPPPGDAGRAPMLLPISARSEDALRALAEAYAALLDDPARSVGDVCAAAALRRSHLDHRLTAAGHDAGELRAALQAYIAGDEHRFLASGSTSVDGASGLVFVCPGQGSQWEGMARELMAEEPVFRVAIDAVEAAMSPYVEWSLSEQLAAGTSAGRALDDIDVVQPTLFAIQVGLAELWRSWGVEPDAVVGHSMGEVAAAHIAGALSLDDAARIITLRSELLHRISGRGAMAVVGLDADDAEAAIEAHADRVSVAVSNSRSSTVLSGDPAALDEVLSRLESQEVFCRRVNVDVASHSPQVDELVDELVSGLAGVVGGPTRVPFISTVSGAVVGGTELEAAYWGRNLRQPVRFAAALETLLDSGHSRFVELSPHPVLLMSIQETFDASSRSGVAIGSMHREADEQATMWSALGGLYCDGHPVDWRAIHGTVPAEPTLPRYPWQRQRHWLDAEGDAAGPRGRKDDSMLGWPIRIVDGGVVRAWENRIDPGDPRLVGGNRVRGHVELPVSTTLEMMLRAAETLGQDGLSDVRFEAPGVLATDGPTTAQTVVDLDAGRRGMVSVHLRTGERWTRVARAALGALTIESPATDLPEADDETGDAMYRRLADHGVELGDPLRCIRSLRRGPDVVGALVDSAPPVAAEVAALEACVQVAGETLADADGTAQPLLAIAADTVRRPGHPSAQMSCVAARGHGAADGSAPGQPSGAVDVRVVDDAGREVAAIGGLVLEHRAPPVAPVDDWFYALDWRRDDDADPGDDEAPRSWLVFVDEQGHGAALVDALRASGAPCTAVTRGEQFVRREPDHYEVRATEPDDLARLLDEQGGDAVELVFMWGLDDGGLEPTVGELERAQRLGCGVLLDLARAMAGTDRTCRIRVVTSGVHRIVPGDGTERIGQAPLWGFGRAFEEELSDVWAGLVDVDPNADPTSVAQQLLAELRRPDAAGEVALRGDDRYLSSLVRQTVAPSSAVRFRHDATVLVTGGFGAVGRRLDEWLVEHGARRLVLLGRTALPPRSAWATLDPDSPAGRRAAFVQHLERLGASVHVASIDVGDAEALRAFLDDFRDEGWPPIRSVFHAAALFGGELVHELDQEILHEQLMAKMAGAWTLSEELPDLDHFVLFSSIAAVVPVPGQSAYGAANAFLDVLAERRAAAGRAALSVNWGIWKGSAEVFRGEVGQQRGDDGPAFKDTADALASARGIHGFSMAEGFDALGRLLVDGTSHVMVAPIDWAAFAGARTARPLGLATELIESAAASAEEGSSTSAATLLDELAACAPEDRTELVEAALRRVLGGVLRMPESQIGAQQPFGSLGLDSMMAIELRNRLEAELRTKLSATVAWNYPTVRELGGYVLGRVVLTSEPERATTDETADDGEAGGSAIAAEIAELTEEDALSALIGESGT